MSLGLKQRQQLDQSILGLSLAELFLALLFLMVAGLLALLVENANKLTASEQTLEKIAALVSQEEQALSATELTGFIDEVESLQQRYAPLEPIAQALQFQSASDREAGSEEASGMVQLWANIIATQDPELVLENEQKLQSQYLEVARLEAAIDELQAANKHLPSCWYYKDSDDSKPNKEIKLFDIRIHDSNLEVYNHDVSRFEAGLLDLGDPAGMPPSPSEHMGTRISYDQFLAKFVPFYNAGETKQVQAYRCRFYVDLWDSTSSKEMYQNRIEYIESVFYKYRNKQSAWPH